jgi:uncharacterized membrane-anchored protein
VKQYRQVFFLIGSILLLAFSELSFADPNPFETTETKQETTSDSQPASLSKDPASKKQEALEIAQKAIRAATKGPAEIQLLDQGTLALPEGYLFIPADQASELMRIMGNKTGPEFIGLIISGQSGLEWFIMVQYSKLGYINDDDAASLNADKLLTVIRDNTQKENEERLAKGFPPLNIERWIKAPTYNATAHQLVWSVLANEGNPENIVNYNAFALGREGALIFTLVAPSSTIETSKQDEEKILAALHYNQGKRYEDFVEGTDQVAAYGLAALVTGLVAKKLGLLALMSVFFVKFWKILALIVLAFSSKIKKLFKKTESAPRKLK